MADFTSKQATVANEMTALEINIQAFHNNLALFGESFRRETFRDMAIAGGAGLAAGLLAAWALGRPGIRQAQGETR